MDYQSAQPSGSQIFALKKMKILFLAHRLPFPPNKGDKLRAYRILKHLARLGHQVYLACTVDEPADLAYLPELSPYCAAIDTALISPRWSRLRTIFYLPTKRPLTLPFFYSLKLAASVSYRIRQEKIDLIFIFSSAMAQYVENYPEVPKILDFVDADSEKWRQYADYAPFPMSVVYRREARLLQEYEQYCGQRIRWGTVVTEKEKQLLAGHIPADKLVVIGNGIDLAYYDEVVYDAGGNKDNNSSGPILIFVGQMDYFAYAEGIEWFCRYSYPKIKQAFPQVKFYIVGKNPPARLRRLARKDPSIILTGFVPDVRPYLKRATLYIAPLRVAPGLQNKLLEAMAMRLPVLSTSTAAEGIGAKAGKEIVVEDAATLFARQAISLLKDNDLRAEIAGQGRRMVENRYDWDSSLKKWDKLLVLIEQKKSLFLEKVVAFEPTKGEEGFK